MPLNNVALKQAEHWVQRSACLTSSPFSISNVKFFIMHKNSPHLDGAYAAFGKITDGMDVVNKIAETATDYSDRPLENQVMKSVTVECFGVEYPEPEKL